MQLPENFRTAITAAAYLTAKEAYPEKPIRILNNPGAILIPGMRTIEIPSVEDLGSSTYRLFFIDTDGLALDVNPDVSFSIEGASPDLQQRIEHTLEKTGFTPAKKFSRRNEKTLRHYGFLFDEEKKAEHIDRLAKKYPKETEGIAELARQTDVSKFSQTYLGMLATKEDGFMGIPYSNLERAGQLAAGVAFIVTAALLKPEAAAQMWQVYNDLLINHGIISTLATNATTTAIFYGSGDAAAQFIEGRCFDRQRLQRTTLLGSLYGIEFSGTYPLINRIGASADMFWNSLVKGVVDIVGYGIGLFNQRHIYLVSQKHFNPLDYFRVDKFWKSIIRDPQFRKKWREVAYFGIGFWIPYQTWNRFAHDPSQQIFYVCMAAPGFAAFISLVSHEKKELLEFQQVMSSLQAAKEN